MSRPARPSTTLMASRYSTSAPGPATASISMSRMTACFSSVASRVSVGRSKCGTFTVGRSSCGKTLVRRRTSIGRRTAAISSRRPSRRISATRTDSSCGFASGSYCSTSRPKSCGTSLGNWWSAASTPTRVNTLPRRRRSKLSGSVTTPPAAAAATVCRLANSLKDCGRNSSRSRS